MLRFILEVTHSKTVVSKREILVVSVLLKV